MVEITEEEAKFLKSILAKTVDSPTKVQAKEIPVKVEKKKLDLDAKTKNEKLKKPFQEIWCYILDKQTQSYNLIRINPFKDNFIVMDGITYAVDRKMIMGKMVGYDPMRDILSGLRSFRRLLQGNRLGVLMFMKPSQQEIEAFENSKDKQPDDKYIVTPFYRDIVEPITQMPVFDEKGKQQGFVETVACEPSLLKVIATTQIFPNMIRSLRLMELKGKGGRMWKWILIGAVIFVVIITILFLFTSGTMDAIF